MHNDKTTVVNNFNGNVDTLKYKRSLFVQFSFCVQMGKLEIKVVAYFLNRSVKRN